VIRVCLFVFCIFFFFFFFFSFFLFFFFFFGVKCSRVWRPLLIEGIPSPCYSGGLAESAYPDLSSRGSAGRVVRERMVM